jgi:GNAT superfamily N-acetyltransferase
MVIDKVALARTMKRLSAYVDKRCRPQGLIQHTFEAAPFGAACVSISPGEESPYASANRNRIYLCGTDGGLTAEGLARLFKLFDDAGVSRFFVWLSPGPDMNAVRDWLSGSGLSRVAHVAYPTLTRDTSQPAPVFTDLEVRQLAVEDATRAFEHIDGWAWPEFHRSVGAPGMTHFIAYDGNRPVGSAALCVFEGLGCLCMAFTAESDRRRGAQQALISKRIEKATALGCRTLVSETLSFLENSLGNLRKAGFEPVYDKEVYSSKPD